jgi:hypothetical protein
VHRLLRDRAPVRGVLAGALPDPADGISPSGECPALGIGEALGEAQPRGLGG